MTPPEQTLSLGLLGGTFDPIHYAHLFIAEAARVELGLDRILFLPTGNAPHRRHTAAPAHHRLAMLRLAIASNPHFAIDVSDLEPDATGYTADLLPKLRARYPDASLTFIVGGDSPLDTPWQRFDEVLAMLDAFVIAPRSGSSAEYDARLDAFLKTLAETTRAKIQVLDLPIQTTSATIIRTRIAHDDSVRYLLPDTVARYISEQGLYRAARTE